MQPGFSPGAELMPEEDMSRRIPKEATRQQSSLLRCKGWGAQDLEKPHVPRDGDHEEETLSETGLHTDGNRETLPNPKYAIKILNLRVSRANPSIMGTSLTSHHHGLILPSVIY